MGKIIKNQFLLYICQLQMSALRPKVFTFCIFPYSQKTTLEFSIKVPSQFSFILVLPISFTILKRDKLRFTLASFYVLMRGWPKIAVLCILSKLYLFFYSQLPIYVIRQICDTYTTFCAVVMKRDSLWALNLSMFGLIMIIIIR